LPTRLAFSCADATTLSALTAIFSRGDAPHLPIGVTPATTGTPQQSPSRITVLHAAATAFAATCAPEIRRLRYVATAEQLARLHHIQRRLLPHTAPEIAHPDSLTAHERRAHREEHRAIVAHAPVISYRERMRISENACIDAGTQVLEHKSNERLRSSRPRHMPAAGFGMVSAPVSARRVQTFPAGRSAFHFSSRIIPLPSLGT